MNNIVKLLPLILCTLVFASHNVWAAASSIDKLVSISDSTKCIECHEDVAEEWKTSSHSHSFTNLDVLTSIKRELNTSGVKKEDALKSCLACHAPQIKHASDETVNNIIALIANSSDQEGNDNFDATIKILESINIDCRVCHMLKSMPEGKTSPKIIYGPGWNEHEHSHMEEFSFDTLKSEYLVSSDFCKKCHRNIKEGDSTHTFSTVHSDHIKNSINLGNTCKECHMSSGHSFKHNNKPGDSQ